MVLCYGALFFCFLFLVFNALLKLESNFVIGYKKTKTTLMGFLVPSNKKTKATLMGVLVRWFLVTKK